MSCRCQFVFFFSPNSWLDGGLVLFGLAGGMYNTIRYNTMTTREFSFFQKLIIMEIVMFKYPSFGPPIHSFIHYPLRRSPSFRGSHRTRHILRSTTYFPLYKPPAAHPQRLQLHSYNYATLPAQQAQISPSSIVSDFRAGLIGPRVSWHCVIHRRSWHLNTLLY